MTFPITTKSLLREKRGGFHNHPSTPNTQPRLANHRKELLSFPCIFHISFLMIRDTGRLFPEASYVLFIRVHVQLLSRAQPFWPPRLLACQAPLPMELSRQEYWSGLPFPTPGDLPDPGIKPTSLGSRALAGRFFYHPRSLGSPALCLYTNACICIYVCLFFSHKEYTVCSSTLLLLLLCFFPLLNHLFRKPEKFVTVTELG